MRTKLTILAAAAAMLMSSAATAHDEYIVEGKVSAVTKEAINVTISTGQVAKLKVDKDTRVMSAGKRVTLKDLKVGQSVQATGIGDTRLDLMAIDLVIQPAKRRAR